MAAIIDEETHRIEGTRTTVYHVMDYYVDNCPVEQIAGELRLTAEQVRAAIVFIEVHKAEVMAEYRKMLEREVRGNSPKVKARLAQTHEKMLRLKEELKSRAQTSGGRQHRRPGEGIDELLKKFGLERNR